METIFYDDTAKFLDDVLPTLEREEAVNGLILGVASNMPSKPSEDQLLALVKSNDGIELVAIHTPPFNLAFSVTGFNTSSSIHVLVDALKNQSKNIPGVIGPDKSAEELASIWCLKSGQTSKKTMRQKIYELRKVIFPKRISGIMRIAKIDDLEFMIDWREQFQIDVGLTMQREDINRRLTSDIEKERLFILEDRKPVSTAMVQREIPHGICVSGIFTPRSLRKKGYASSLVAAVSQLMLDQGKEFCCLYTDLSNPTSNSIYQKVGYRPVGDSAMFVFGD